MANVAREREANASLTAEVRSKWGDPRVRVMRIRWATGGPAGGVIEVELQRDLSDTSFEKIKDVRVQTAGAPWRERKSCLDPDVLRAIADALPDTLPP